MHFDPPLIPGVLRRRYKRFLADVGLGGRPRDHCPLRGALAWRAEVSTEGIELKHALTVFCPVRERPIPTA